MLWKWFVGSQEDLKTYQEGSYQEAVMMDHLKATRVCLNAVSGPKQSFQLMLTALAKTRF